MSGEHIEDGGTGLLSEVQCPHCWETFRPEDTLWIPSENDALRGDSKLGEYALRRFAAERFDVHGHAIDEKCGRAQGFACKRCHLVVPRAMFDLPPFFVSLIGAPGSGKTFFLPAMTWSLRTAPVLHDYLTFQDADPRLNTKLHGYEEQLFMPGDASVPVTLEKTVELGGENLYDVVTIDNQEYEYPRPLVFKLKRKEKSGGPLGVNDRALCFYDNAGESYLASASALSASKINHLAHCNLMMFLFDPTTHPKMRAAAAKVGRDPQLSRPLPNVVMQYTILENVADRARQLRGAKARSEGGDPLVVVITKVDCWYMLIDRYKEIMSLKSLSLSSSGRLALRQDVIQELSKAARATLVKYAPEIVNAAEGVSQNVAYIPVSATGCNVKPVGERFGVRPRDIRPINCVLPLLYGMHMANASLLPVASGVTQGGGDIGAGVAE